MTPVIQEVARAFTPASLTTRNLPAGVCGRMTGVGLVYEESDTFGTIWAAGCLDASRRRVAEGKVQLFAAGQMGHEYGVRSHIGIVRELTPRGREEWLTADLLDTEDGRRAKEYVHAVLQAGGTTGLSIGAYVVERDPRNPERFTAVQVEEFTLTPRPAVPGAEVATVRQHPRGGSRLATMAERIAALAELRLADYRRADLLRADYLRRDYLARTRPATMAERLAAIEAVRRMAS